MNPLQKAEYDEYGEMKDTRQKKNAPVASDASKHTFYVLNSQMRLKFSARNEVMPCPIFHKIFTSVFSSQIISYFSVKCCSSLLPSKRLRLFLPIPSSIALIALRQSAST
jgi:hypothetical protein